MTFAIHSADGKGFGAGMADYPPPSIETCEVCKQALAAGVSRLVVIASHREAYRR